MTCTVTLHKKNTLMSLFYYVFSMWLWPKFEGDPLTENIRFSPGEVQKLSNDLQKNDGRGHVALKTKITIFKQEDHDGPAPSWKAAGASKLNIYCNHTCATVHQQDQSHGANSSQLIMWTVKFT